MKKITLVLISLMVMCIFTGCANNIAVISEIQQILDQNDAQVLTAFGNNYEAKRDLLNSSELHSEGLIALCTNPEPLNIKNYTVQKWFNEAVERTELTAEQEVQIATIGEFTFNQALLLKTNLTTEGLIAVCENPGSLNLKNPTVQSWLKDAIERTELTAEQEVQIAQMGEFAYSSALLSRTNLTPEGLIAVCENPGSMNLKNPTIQNLFNHAIKRTELTEEQKTLIAKSKLKGLGLF